MTHIPLEIALHRQEYFDNEHLPCSKTFFLCKVKKNSGIKSGNFFWKKKLQKKNWKRDV